MTNSSDQIRRAAKCSRTQIGETGTYNFNTAFWFSEELTDWHGSQTSYNRWLKKKQGETVKCLF